MVIISRNKEKLDRAARDIGGVPAKVFKCSHQVSTSSPLVVHKLMRLDLDHNLENLL